MQIIVRNDNERHYVHHNLFRDIPKGSGNGFETLQLITENNPFDPPPGDCNTRIENNLFVKCNGEAEIISVKSNGNILKGNVFRASQGALVLRHGDDNKVVGNYFFGDGEEGTGGVRLQGAREPFLVLVQNDQPENWVWRNNIAFGNKVQRSFEGFSILDPKLRLLDNGLAVPTKTTEQVENFTKETTVAIDLFGTIRPDNTSVGAIQYAPEVTGARILDEASVGPQAFERE